MPEPALGRVARAVDLETFAAGVHCLHGHLIPGQGTGLVGTNDRSASQGFNCRQLADNDVALGHAPHADGQSDGYCHWQAFGNGGNRQSHGGDESLNQVFAA